jgi:hypothetical protein
MFTCLNNLSEGPRKEYQVVIDKLFAELSGSDLNSRDTLLKAAVVLKNKEEEIGLLKKQLQDLQNKLAQGNLINSQESLFSRSLSNKINTNTNQNKTVLNS